MPGAWPGTVYTSAVTVCRTCGHRNPQAARSCAACGSPLDADGRSREERKVVTTLFCDLVEFTSRFDLADPEDVQDTLATYHARVRREIERFGGTVEKFIGDAVMAVYGAPVAHEDDAQRAVFSALRIPPVIEELNETNHDLPLAVRIGIETGVAVVSVGAESSEQGIAIGDVVNTASRLQGVAPIGGILVGEGTYRLTRDLFDYEPLDPVQVKGKAEALPVWVAKAARSRFGTEVQHRSSTPFVGREDELELLKHTFARAAREPSVQLVTLLGEPGVGKSRMLGELFSHLDDQPELVTWRQGRCLPYGEGVTYWALGQIVKAQAGILESDDAGTARAKLSACVEGLVEDGAEHEWLRARLAPLVGLAAPQPDPVEQMESFSAWRRFLEAIASIRPLVIAIEDLHWAHPAMVEFVEHVLEWSAGFPMLIVCTARPEMLQRDPRWGGGMRNSVMVSLAPLSDGETLRLLEHVLAPETGSDVRDLIAERSGGNPLFAEEFARMLDERPEPPGATEAATLSSSAPESLQAIIAARLDTLAPEQKSLVQDASVIGRVFWPSAVAAVGATDPESVRIGLHELAHRELVRPARVSSIQGDTEYAFAHGLIRDVAYGQIPRLARVDKHVAAAEWIERMAAERLSDRAELLAHHYGRALELSRAAGSEAVDALGVSTRRALMMAGENAMTLDVSRATVCFDEVLALLPADHPERASALYFKAEAVKDAGRYEEAERGYREAISAFRAIGDRVGEGAGLTKLANVLWERGASPRAASASPRRWRSSSPNPPASTSPRVSLRGVGPDRRGVVLGRDRLVRPLARAGHQARRRMARVAGLSYRGVARCFLGDMGGLHDLRRALEVAESHGSSREHALALLVRAEVEWATEGPVVALETVREGGDLAERRGLMDMGSGSTRSASGRSSTSGRGTSSSRSRTTSCVGRGRPAATTRPGSRSPGSPRSSCGGAGRPRPPTLRPNRCPLGEHPRRPGPRPGRGRRRARGGPRGSRAGRDPDRRGARARDGGLAGLVPRELPRGPRPGLRRDRRRAARAAADRRREGHRATTRAVPALGQGRDGGGARAPRCRNRAVRTGRRGLDRVRPPARDRDRAARREPLPRRSRRPGAARPRPAGRGDLHRARRRLARSRGTPEGTPR